MIQSEIFLIQNIEMSAEREISYKPILIFVPLGLLAGFGFLGLCSLTLRATLFLILTCIAIGIAYTWYLDKTKSYHPLLDRLLLWFNLGLILGMTGWYIIAKLIIRAASLGTLN